MTYRPAALALVIACLPHWAFAQPASLSTHPKVAVAIEAARVWLDAQRDFEQIPGLSVAVVADQDVVWASGFGFAHIEGQVPATPDTLYSICSVSKLFTAIAVMQQRDAGRLRLDDPVRVHLPWFDIKQTAPESGDVTIRGILTHSSGLPRESAHPYWTGPDFAFPTREAIIEALDSQETLYPADTYFQYSNLGLTLAGEVAAAAAGRAYDELIRSAILDPLGLANTFPEMPATERGQRLATGYSAIGRDGRRVPVGFFETRGIAPAAGFASSVNDLAKFASWQFRLLSQGGTEVLRATTLREMHRVHWVDPDFETTWGLGFVVLRDDNRTIVGHGGSCPGFRTQFVLVPADRVAVVVMANAQGVDTNRFAQRVLDLVAPAIKAASKADTPAGTPPDPALDAFLGNYAQGFAGEIAIIRWEDGLATIGLPTMNPRQAVSKLKQTGPQTFRRVRKDETLGEEYAFELGPDGRATRFMVHSNIYTRVR